MGESSSDHASPSSNNVLPQPTLVAVGEEDDEPPCSGSRPHSTTDNVKQQKEPVPPDLRTPKCATIVSPAEDAIITPPSESHRAGPSKSFFTRRRTMSHDVEKNERAISGDNAFVDVPRGQRNNTLPPTLTKMSRLGMLFHPTRPLGPAPSYLQSLQATLTYNYLNVCLVFIPVSWALHWAQQSPTLVFVFSALGIVPLAALLGFGTEQIALRTSDSVGGLLNATLGNVVEMIIAGIALSECKLELVQSSLLGGLLSNLLLVLGMAFLVGGYRFHSQEFQPMVAQLNSSLMTVSVMSLIVPAAFHEYIGDRLRPGLELSVLLQLSRGSAVILMVIYFAYLVFQFYSHNHLFLDAKTLSTVGARSSKRSSQGSTSSLGHVSTIDTQTLPGPATATISSTTSSSSSDSSEIEYPKLNTLAALILLVAITALTYVTAEFLVDSLEGLVADHPNISQEWLTLIVIPVISNAAEHTTAVVVASKGKFDLAMSVAVGSCIQIALFVIPILVLVAWGMDKPLTLLFDPLEILVLFFSVLLVKFAVEDGRSHWMSGTVLVSVYVLIALSFWNFPETVRMLQGQPLQCS